jgi:hypothetical protein
MVTFTEHELVPTSEVAVSVYIVVVASITVELPTSDTDWPGAKPALSALETFHEIVVVAPAAIRLGFADSVHEGFAGPAGSASVRVLDIATWIGACVAKNEPDDV